MTEDQVVNMLLILQDIDDSAAYSAGFLALLVGLLVAFLCFYMLKR